MDKSKLKSKTTEKARLSIAERAQASTVRDPSAHAKLQIAELDKTAKRSMMKRKLCNEKIESDAKEIQQIEDQIQMLKLRYDPLCQSLAEAKERKQHLISMLESCSGTEKRIMQDTKDTVHARMIDDCKLSKKISTMELQSLRGFTMTPESTFHQTATLSPPS